jgi:hypothetical protein
MPDTIADQSLINLVFRDKVLRARQTPMEERFLDGPRLYDLNCQIICGAISSQFPEFSNEQVKQEYSRRLQIARSIDSAGIFRDAGFTDE